MNITNYSVYPHKPCFLLQWPNTRILLDTPFDLTPFFSFFPHAYQSPRLKNANIARKFNIPYLKDLGNRVYVQTPPEIFHVSTDLLKMETIDAILVSNYDSFIGLPFYTEGSGFRGKIYVTEIAFQYGKLLMEEMLEFISRVEEVPGNKNWKREEVCGKFPNPPFQNPVEWRPFYTSEDVHNCLTKVITLTFNQTIDIFRIKVTPVASGYTYGSAYWTITTENENLAYLSAANPSATDVKQMEITPLRSVDYILVSSLSRLVDTTAQSMGHALSRTITDTLRSHGSVILPICPVGPIFEIIEAISHVIATTNGIPIDTPMYFISPIAKSALATASISAEWMSEDRLSNVYVPDEPYNHSAIMKTGRLKIYDSLHGNFSKEMKTPCIIFASHTSLRIGDAAHMVEVLGSDPKNAVILTDPDLPCEDVREPFRQLPIRFINIPMDFRMDFSVFDKLLQEVKPKYVLSSSFYTRSASRRPDLQINYEKLWPIEYDECVQLTKLSRNKRKLVTVSVHPDIVKNLDFKQHPTKKLAIASVACHLSAYNDDFKLIPAKGAIVKRKYGKLSAQKVLKALRLNNLDAREDKNEEETIFEIDELEAKITVKNDGKGTKITANKEESREKILGIIRSLLVEDDGIVGRKTEETKSATS